MGGCYNYSCTAAKTHVDPILSFIQLLSCLACTNFNKNTAYGSFFHALSMFLQYHYTRSLRDGLELK